jgi:hypothetical protein
MSCSSRWIFPILSFLLCLNRTLYESDGVATAGTVGYDGEELSHAWDEWAVENGKLAYYLGPILPLKPGSSEFAQGTLDAEIASAPPGVGEQVLNFLNDVYKRRGDYSVIYICFGTGFWFVFVLFLNYYKLILSY